MESIQLKGGKKKKMNKAMFGLFFVFMLFSISSVSAVSTYQETADTVVFSGYPDSVDQANIVDGDWETYGRQGFWTGGHGGINVELTYNIPTDVTSAIWKVKDGEGVAELEIPSSCFVDGNLNLVVSTSSNFEMDTSPGMTITWECEENVLRTFTGQDISGYIYEDAVIWNGEVTEPEEPEEPTECDYYVGETINLPQITTSLELDDSATHKMYLACMYSLDGDSGYEIMSETQNCQGEAQTFITESGGEIEYDLAIAYRERQWNQLEGQWETISEGTDVQLSEVYTICSIPDDSEGFNDFVGWLSGVLCQLFGWFC